MVGSAGRALTSPGVTHGAPGYAPTSGCHDLPSAAAAAASGSRREGGGGGGRVEGAVSEREKKGVSGASPREGERARAEPAFRVASSSSPRRPAPACQPALLPPRAAELQ